MPGVRKVWGPDSATVRDTALELQLEYGVLVRLEITPSAVPKRGALYVRAVAEVPGPDGGLVTANWQGDYFPTREIKTLTALFYGLLVRLDRGLSIRRQGTAERARQDQTTFLGE